VHLHEYQGWIELFGLVDDDPMYQKRILGLISGATLPVVALGFIKALVDYIKPENANAVLDLEQHKGQWYLRLNKTETPYLADVLAYGINFAQHNNLSFIWTDNQGNFGYLGDKEFCYDIVSTNANMYNDFIKKEKR
jgi:hypothetical protein